jgi:hypothetical protein
MMSWDRLDSKLRPSWVLLRQRQNRFWGPSRNPDPVFGRQEKRAVFGPFLFDKLWILGSILRGLSYRPDREFR